MSASAKIVSTNPPAVRGAAGLATSARERAVAGLLAIAFGLVIFLGTGFAAPSFLHNSTHDTRHALGLPCH